MAVILLYKIGPQIIEQCEKFYTLGCPHGILLRTVQPKFGRFFCPSVFVKCPDFRLKMSDQTYFHLQYEILSHVNLCKSLFLAASVDFSKQISDIFSRDLLQ